MLAGSKPVSRYWLGIEGRCPALRQLSGDSVYDAAKGLCMNPKAEKGPLAEHPGPEAASIWVVRWWVEKLQLAESMFLELNSCHVQISKRKR